MSGNREAYTYLPRSIVDFPDPEEVCVIMRKAGIVSIEIHRLTFGVATIHVGNKDNCSR